MQKSKKPRENQKNQKKQKKQYSRTLACWPYLQTSGILFFFFLLVFSRFFGFLHFYFCKSPGILFFFSFFVFFGFLEVLWIWHFYFCRSGKLEVFWNCKGIGRKEVGITFSFFLAMPQSYKNAKNWRFFTVFKYIYKKTCKKHSVFKCFCV